MPLLKALEDVLIILAQHDQALLYSTLITASILYEKDEPELVQQLLKKIIQWLTPEEKNLLYEKLPKKYRK
jgi:hypothetical protein